MVSAPLDSGSSGSGSSYGRATALCSCTQRASLNPGVLMVPANLLLGVTLRWTNIPSRGEQKYSQSVTKNPLVGVTPVLSL